MRKNIRSLARISSVALILALGTVALPKATPTFAYARDLTYTGPTTSNEGDTVVSRLGYFSDTCQDVSLFSATVTWGDLNADGAKLLNEGPSPLGNDNNGNPLCQYGVYDTHVFQEEGNKNVLITVKNKTDGGTDQISAIDSVADAALTPTKVSTITPTEGMHFVSLELGQFQDANQTTDPNPSGNGTVCNATTAEYTVSINWGDNTTPTSGTLRNLYNACTFAVDGSHLYKEEGQFPVTVTVTDHDSTAVINAIAQVTDASLTAVTGSGMNGWEGKTFDNQYLGTFNDTNPGCNVNDFSASIDWGDATPVDISTWSVVLNEANGKCNFDVFGSHVFSEQGSYHPVVTITDHLSTVQLTDTMKIEDQILQSTSHGNFNAVEGAPIGGAVPGNPGLGPMQLLGTVHDLAGTSPDPAVAPYCDIADYKIAVNWGDTNPGVVDTTASDFVAIPTTQSGFGPGSCSFDIYGKHIYHEQNFAGYPVSGTVTDSNGKAVVLTENAVVADAALSKVTELTFTQTEGQQFDQYVGTFHDAAGDTVPADCDIKDFTAVIDWGDNTTQTVHADPVLTNVPNIIPDVGTCNFKVIGRHTYHEENPNPGAGGGYPVTVTVSDTTFDTTILHSTANVNAVDAALTNSTPDGSLAHLAQTEGKPFANYYLGSFQDHAFTVGNPTDCNPADYVVTIDWGDGAANPHQGPITVVHAPQDSLGKIQLADGTNIPAATCTFDVYGSYNYLEESFPGTYTVNVNVVDNGVPAFPGAPHPVINWNDTMTVADAALVTQPAPQFNNLTFHPIEGKPDVNQYLGTIVDTDPGCSAGDLNNAPGSITVNWGDGTPLDINNPASGGATAFAVVSHDHSVTSCAIDIYGTHNYAEDSSAADSHTYPVTVTVVDHNAKTVLNHTADVVDAALTTVATPASPAPTFTEGILDPASALHYLGTVHDAAGDTLGAGNCDLAGSDYHAVINWGDGTSDTVTQNLSAAGQLINATAPHAGVCNFDVMGAHKYTEETEPGILQKLSITFVDEAGSTTSLLDPTIVQDAPLVALANPLASSQNCTLLTACTVRVAVFKDLSTTCAAEGENLNSETFHYPTQINWGDGSPLDSNVTITADPVIPCQFNVSGTHIYTTPTDTGSPFNIVSLITDEGGSAVTASAGSGSGTSVPVSPIQSGVFRYATAAYAYPQGMSTPTYLLHAGFYGAPLYNPSHLAFMDKQQNLYIKSETQGAQCNTLHAKPQQCFARTVAIDCTSLNAVTIWVQYHPNGVNSTPMRFIKLELGSVSTMRFFRITMSSASNPAVGVVSNEPSVPPPGAINVSCTPAGGVHHK